MTLTLISIYGQEMKPEVQAWSHLALWDLLTIFHCCRTVVFAHNHEIREQGKFILEFQATGDIMKLVN